MRGHTGAFPIGSLTDIYETLDESNEVLAADAVLWNEEYPDVTAYLKQRTAEGNPVGNSWELYFKTSTKDENNVEWLHDCMFSAACLVDNPAYGPTRTRILSIAEDLSKKTESELMEEERKQIEALMSQLSAMYSILDEKYMLTFEIEEAELSKTSSLEDFSNRFSDFVTKLDDRAKSAGVSLQETEASLAATKTELETATAELTTLKTEKAQAEKQALVETRKEALAGIGLVFEDETKLGRYVVMSEELFDQCIEDLKTVKGSSKEVAENKKPIRIPEPTGSVDTIDIKSAHNDVIKEKKRG